MAWTLFITATILLALGVPVAFSLAAAALLAVAIDDRYTAIVVLKEMFTGIDSFPLLAVPFFILAAELMTGGKLTEVLLRFASQFVGHRRGGLGHANVLSLTFFSGISGSALADAAGPGSMMIKMMDKAGYSKAYAAALTASTAIVGPIIPPSIIMIIYALQDDRVSAGALFMAGLLPGLLIAVAMMIVNQIVSTRRHYRADELRPSAREMLRNTVNAIPALLLPVIILGGIRAGIFTPTEASVVAVVYALAVRGIHLPLVALEKRADHSVALGDLDCIGAADRRRECGFRLGADDRERSAIAGALDHRARGGSDHALLLLINVLLLIFGIFIEPLPGVMVLVPILAPVAHAAGIDPVHFAMIVIYNLTLGLITPPVGGLLAVTSAVSKVPIGALVRELRPFLLAHLIVLLIVTLVPALSTWLPYSSGLAKPL